MLAHLMLRIVLVILALIAIAGLTLPWLLVRPASLDQLPERPFADSHRLDVAGVNLHYRWRDGAADRPGVVLIHGFSGSAFSWRKTMDALEQRGLAVLAPDLPPFGYSDKRPVDAPWAELVTALIASRMSERELILIGHSMGARVVTELAHQHQDRTSQLILVAGTPGAGPRGGGMVNWLAAQPTAARWAELIGAGRVVNRERIAEALASAYGQEPDEPAIEGYLQPLMIPGTISSLLLRISTTRSARLERPDLPISLIWGERDSWVPIGGAHELVRRWPQARLHLMPGLGHNPMETDPEAFMAILDSVLGIDPAAADTMDDGG